MPEIQGLPFSFRQLANVCKHKLVWFCKKLPLDKSYHDQKYDMCNERNCPIWKRKFKEKRRAEKPCTAVIRHGPGHQSTTRCQCKGPHEIHEARYGLHGELATWRGDETFSGFFDEPPYVEED